MWRVRGVVLFVEEDVIFYPAVTKCAAINVQVCFQFACFEVLFSTKSKAMMRSALSRSLK